MGSRFARLVCTGEEVSFAKDGVEGKYEKRKAGVEMRDRRDIAYAIAWRIPCQ